MEGKKIVPEKKTTEKSTAVVKQPELSESALLVRMAIDKDLDPEKLDKILDMHERMKASQNKERFEQAFSEMKGELPIITKSMDAKNDDGSTMYSFAPLEELQEKCDPILSKYGFAYYWEESFIEATNCKRVIFYLSAHGHTRSNYFDVPDIQGTRRNNPIQVAGMKSSYGRRYTFQSGVGMIIKGEDNDANYLTFNDAVEYSEQITWLKACENLEDLKDVWGRLYQDLKKSGDNIGRDILMEVYTKQKKAVTNG